MSLAHSQWFSPFSFQFKFIWCRWLIKKQPYHFSHKEWNGWNQDSHRLGIGNHDYLMWNFWITISRSKSVFRYWHYICKWHYIVLSLFFSLMKPIYLNTEKFLLLKSRIVFKHYNIKLKDEFLILSLYCRFHLAFKLFMFKFINY